uniref:Uncharacterized protein n=1 Tax=Oryza brachyantha TaxID=4533 RepID=J3N083_ORYBR
MAHIKSLQGLLGCGLVIQNLRQQLKIQRVAINREIRRIEFVVLAPTLLPRIGGRCTPDGSSPTSREGAVAAGSPRKNLHLSVPDSTLDNSNVTKRPCRAAERHGGFERRRQREVAERRAAGVSV